MLGFIAQLIRQRRERVNDLIVYLGNDRTLDVYDRQKSLPWDDDLSEHDLERLHAAGFSDEIIRGHVEAFQRMVTVIK